MTVATFILGIYANSRVQDQTEKCQQGNVLYVIRQISPIQTETEINSQCFRLSRKSKSRGICKAVKPHQGAQEELQTNFEPGKSGQEEGIRAQALFYQKQVSRALS